MLFKMHKLIMKMGDFKMLDNKTVKKLTMELPKYAHCAIICDRTGCGKTEFVLDLLETEYKGVFEHIVILCPTIEWNKAYKSRSWIGNIHKPKIKKYKNCQPY